MQPHGDEATKQEKQFKVNPWSAVRIIFFKVLGTTHADSIREISLSIVQDSPPMTRQPPGFGDLRNEGFYENALTKQSKQKRKKGPESFELAC